MDPNNRHPVGQKAEKFIESWLFAGRWLLAPLYLGLLAGLVVIVVVFFREMVTMLTEIGHSTAGEVAVQTLDLIDLALLGNLIVMIILAGYENFVSKINAADNSPDKPRWMGRIDFSGLKLKLIGSLVAISAIQLLKDFLRINEIKDFTPIGWQIGIHLTFVVSGVLFAVTDAIAAKSHAAGADD
jgi:uncharacterized protein (TIGR00645 family)